MGCVATVTAYAAFDASSVENVKGPFALTVVGFWPLFCSTTLAPVARPATVPPMLIDGAAGPGDGVPPPPPPPPPPQADSIRLAVNQAPIRRKLPARCITQRTNMRTSDDD